MYMQTNSSCIGIHYCNKLQATRNGQPVTRQLVSEVSLHIERHEPSVIDGNAIFAPKSDQHSPSA